MSKVRVPKHLKRIGYMGRLKSSLKPYTFATADWHCWAKINHPNGNQRENQRKGWTVEPVYALKWRTGKGGKK